MTYALTAVAVIFAGALGAVLRWAIALVFRNSRFPVSPGTLFVNLTGSFALGAIMATDLMQVAPIATTAVAAGFLGAYTTFSTWMVELDDLWERELRWQAIGYAALSVVAGVVLAAGGYGLFSWLG